MAKDRKKLQHIHSSVFDKQPTPESIELGELAVNNNQDGAFISTKNSNGDVVRFSEDATIVDWMEHKEVFPYSGNVLTIDLENNESQLLFKLNQVAGNLSPHYNDVNGARDRNNNEINPMQNSGYTDGAGFAVNMDIYAMQGSNPSFSSVTTTCGAVLSGTTQIKGSDGDCGSLLNVEINNVCVKANENANFYGEDNTNIGISCDGSGKTENVNIISSGDTIINSTNNVTVNTDVLCLNGSTQASLYGNEVNVGKNCNGTSSAVTINISATTINEGGTTINVEGDDYNLTVNNDICLNSKSDVTLYGSASTKVGISCDGTTTATTTTIKGGTTVIDASTNNLGLSAKADIIESSENDIIITADKTICESAGNLAAFFGVEETNIGIDCSGNPISDSVKIYGSNVCIEGDDVYLYGSNETHIGVACDGSKSSSIIYERTPSNEACAITSTTVDDALDEVLDRSKIHLSGTTQSGKTTYTLWQDNGDCVNAVNFEVSEPSGVTCVSELDRHTLAWTYGDVSREVDGGYDPGEDCDASNPTTFVIPKTISDVTSGCIEDNGTCISFCKDLCVDGKVEVTDGLYYTSDERLKENIGDINHAKLSNARNIKFKEFTFKDDDKKALKYGVIAQNVELNKLSELIETREDGMKLVDYTSLMCLKIAYLENEVEKLNSLLANVVGMIDNLKK